MQKGNTNLTTRLFVHIAGIILMAGIFWIFISTFQVLKQESREKDKEIQKYLDLNNVDFGDPLDRSLFYESLNLFNKGQSGKNDSLLVAIDDLRQRQFSNPEYKTGVNTSGLTKETIYGLSTKYLQFVIVFGLILLIIYFSAQRIAVYKFIKMKQHRESYLAQIFKIIVGSKNSGQNIGRDNETGKIILLLLKAAIKGILLMILFSPAYVIAYSVKTTIDTSSIIFMIMLGIVSNGVLIHTANKFYTFLVSESRKGYVQTARVKNLNESYEWDRPGGISIRALFNIKNEFRSHVFQSIFINARFQFIPALKEHASFLITGLIIIEMALNIQGHFCYELLQKILYRQYDIAAFIIFCIFITVKATEIVIDIWEHREKRKYGY